MPSRLSNFKSAYLDSIVIVIIIVVIVESEINHLLRTSDDLPDGGKAIVFGIRHFCLLRGIGCVTGRERLARGREVLKLTVIPQGWRFCSRRIEVCGTTVCCSI